MFDQFSIINKLGTSRLWISTTKDFLPAYLKNTCDEFERNVGRKLMPVKVRVTELLRNAPTLKPRSQLRSPFKGIKSGLKVCR